MVFIFFIFIIAVNNSFDNQSCCRENKSDEQNNAHDFSYLHFVDWLDMCPCICIGIRRGCVFFINKLVAAVAVAVFFFIACIFAADHRRRNGGKNCSFFNRNKSGDCRYVILAALFKSKAHKLACAGL